MRHGLILLTSMLVGVSCSWDMTLYMPDGHAGQLAKTISAAPFQCAVTLPVALSLIITPLRFLSELNASTCNALQLLFSASASMPRSATTQDKSAFSVGYTLPVVLSPAPWRSKLATALVTSTCFGRSEPTQNSVTFIWFGVKVPVLSVQMAVTEPMVSQAESVRTS